MVSNQRKITAGFFFLYSSQIREKESSTEYNKKYEKRGLKTYKT